MINAIKFGGDIKSAPCVNWILAASQSGAEVAELLASRFAASVIEKNPLLIGSIMTIPDLCKTHDLSVVAVEKVLDNLQKRGLITGFVPGDMSAQIVILPAADVYFSKI